MKLLPNFKISSRLARVAYPKLQMAAYRFVDMDTEGASLESRVVEYSFAITRLGKMPTGKVLDIGCTDSGNMISPMLTFMGWEVHGLDNRQLKFNHPNFLFVQGDARQVSLPKGFFDCICAISTIEHIGLKGRYGITIDDPDGDLKTMKRMTSFLAPNGIFLLTVPYGKSAVVKPMQRVYDKERLDKLLSAWHKKTETYYIFEDGHWVEAPEETAAQKDYLKGGRALALVELTLKKG